LSRLFLGVVVFRHHVIIGNEMLSKWRHPSLVDRILKSISLVVKSSFCFDILFIIRRISNYLCNLSITTNVVSSNPIHGEVYLIYYVMKFVSDLQQVSGFLQVLYTVDNLKCIQNNFDIFCIVTNQQISKTTVFSGLQVDLVWFMVFNATINNISVLL
jgi:hypothetical protein